MPADDAPEPPDPLQNPDGTRKKDLRYTEHERANVRVERQLDGSGHLARGDRTKMSVLNFSARAQARTERDPEFDFKHRAAEPAAPAEVEPTALAPPAGADQQPAAEGSLLARIKRIFGG